MLGPFGKLPVSDACAVIVRRDDPRLYKPRWWQRWLLSGRFRAVESADGMPASE